MLRLIIGLCFLIVSEVKLNKMRELERKINDMRHFLILLDQVLLKGADLFVEKVFVVLVDFDHCGRAFHKVHSEVFKVLEQRLVIVNDDRLSILDQKNVPRYQDLDVSADSLLVDFVECNQKF